MSEARVFEELDSPSVVQALKFVFQNSPLGLWVVDEELRFREVNPAWCRMLGQSRADLLRATILDVTHRKDRLHTRTLIEKLLTKQAPQLTTNTRWVRSDGSSVTGRVIAGALDREEAPPLAIAVNELDLSATTARVERMSGHPFEEFACGVAHDINNVLLVIQRSAELLKAGSAATESLEAIALAAERAAGLTKGLLTAGRPLSDAQKNVAAVGPVLERVRLVVERLLPEGVSFRASVRDQQVRVALSPASLDRVLMNLILNARDAMPEGGEVHVEVASVGRQVHMRVVDTGRGIPREHQPKVFEPFFSTKPPSRGTGLGLSIVRSIVEDAGGALSLDSEVGTGTTVSLSLPSVAEAP